ncbi:uncharacterized protein LOC105249011 isoform X2 [Camponotus floridanus]|uniref:uncharacterized protein LOC105249011 isoform X2 n=1 Tax=Camponotus floridanus TaxID=104421 RepID=UPI000DC6772C|nr:uncharacterized protein LOC105249011 isoform X2 [Camponotus floridanus]XP_025262121.1 uncharacterized protein LOC105249011 isoform X2 [Camponotus floridanus]
MGEGKSDRSGKRQRSSSRGVGKSSPDFEITHGKGKEKKGRKGKTKERWPFLEGLTVDELARYRRRRVQDRPKDNLQSYPESGVQQDSASEYRRAFGVNVEELSKENVWPIEGGKSEDYSEETLEDAQSLHHMDFRERKTIEDPSAKEENAFVQLGQGNGTMETRVEAPHFEMSFRRPSLIRRGTSLKCGGDFYTDTETYSAYVPYEGQHRAELARRPTSLKMEGDLDTMTEKCEKFIEWLNVSRPELMRIPTHLKMEGELETSTENQDKYVPFVGARRPELLRRGTNLKLEGDTYFVPEYTDVFRDYHVTDRLQPKKPQTHLKVEGDFFQNTESTENFVHPRIKQTQEIDTKQIKDDDDEEDKWIDDQEEKQRKDEEMRILVSKLEDLNGRPLEIPEYRDAYKDFPRERPKFAKPDDEIGRADGSKVSSPSRSKFSMKIDQDPEYQSKYMDYPRDRPIYRKPPPILRPTNISSGRSSACFGRPVRQEYRAFEYEPTSEVRSQYVPYGYIPRVETLKMPANLRLEGTFDLQPEYRNAYCAKYNRQECTEPKTIYGRGDHSPNVTKRREHYWLRDDNSGQCDKTIAGQEQNAFCVLDTRMHEDNVTGKPPPASRRSSRLSQTMVPRPTQLDLTDRAVTTRISRSPSPTYRLHVCDVDNEPRGFGRRQSPGRGVRSPSVDRTIQDDIRSYSPSFGRSRQDRRINDQPFVVLNNASKNMSGRSEVRRKNRIDRNVDVTVPISRGRPRTPTRWMPPWYDNTNTI